MVTATKASDSFQLLDALRGEPHRLSDYTVPLAVMIYLRWVDFQEAEAEAMAAFDESEYVPLLPASLHWRRWCELPIDDLRYLLTNSLPSAIERVSHSRDPLAGPLRRILPAVHSLSQLRPRSLVHLTDWLAHQPFETPSDRRRLLVLFDDLLDRANGPEAGQFRTPADINELLVALAAPTSSQRLYDPCFGSAGILTTAWEAVQRAEKDDFSRSKRDLLTLAGVEINAQAFAIGLARLALAGASNPQLELGNSLEREGVGSPSKDGFDLVICDPPWGIKVESYGLHHFPVQTNDGTSLFVQHAVSQLCADGRALIVVPQGFLFQQGKTAEVRQWLMESHQVEAVVKLPKGAFLPYTAVQAAILIIRRKAGPTKSVRMADSAGFFLIEQGIEPRGIVPHQISKLTEAIKRAEPSESVWDVSSEVLVELGYDLSPVRREVSALEQALEIIGKEVPVRSLKELCQITTGRSAKSSDLSKGPIGESPVPYIRIGDLQRGQTMKNTSWIADAAAANFGPRHRLRAGDVLLSKGGTIGKAGIVRNGAVGGIASGSLFVFTHISSQLDPHFLTAYLMSKDCQEWLQSRSSGSVISGLRKQFVEDLPVPVPPLQIQERVAADFRNHQVDALTQLAQLLTQDENDQLAKWIDRSLKSLSEQQSRDDEDPSAVVRFRIFGSDFTDVLAWAMPDDDPPPLMSWALNLVNVMELFRGSEEVPLGPALLSMLQSGAKALLSTADQIEGHSPLEGKARELTKTCVQRLEMAADALLKDVRVAVTAQTKSLVAGTKQDVSFLVKNEGPLPLRNFTIDAKNKVFGGTTVFLPERSERPMTAEIEAPEVVGRYVVKPEWFAKTMDGRQVGGTQEVVFDVVTGSADDKDSDLGSSPYFVSEPVGPQRSDIFIGREEIIDRIKRQLVSGNTVLLEGNRRAGKSSILKQLEGLDRIDGRLAIYSSMQASEGDKRATGMPTEKVWRTLAKSIAKGLTSLVPNVPLPDGSILSSSQDAGIAKACRLGISVEDPWEDFLEYSEIALDLVTKQGRGLVLMIDEFDKLQEGIDNGVTSPQIPENIRYLIQNLSGFSAILTGSRRMQRLRHEYWSALYGLGTRVGVTALEPEAARRLVERPVEGRLQYSGEAAKTLIELAAQQPFLIQSICNKVFELAAQSRDRNVTMRMVEEAAERFVEDNEHFASLMDYTESDRRRFLLMLIHGAKKGPDLVTVGVLQEQLHSLKIEVSDDDLVQDLRFLHDLELIDYHGSGGNYTLTVPLMGHWLDFQHDFQALLAKARAEQENQL